MKVISKRDMRRKAARLIGALILIIGISVPVRVISAMPDGIRLSRGGTALIPLAGLDAEVAADSVQVLSSRDDRLAQSVMLTGRQEGNGRLILKFLGIPVKDLQVTVSPKRYVVPGGQSIGVALNMAGVLVVGSSDVGRNPSPARIAGLRSGDLILSVDGAAVTSAQDLSRRMASGQQAELLVARSGRALKFQVQPVSESRDGAYRLGAWVRDSTAGVGTLSYYDPDTNAFGALGHAITDVDTGSLLTVSEGEIYRDNVVGILPGSSREPGELMGEFMSDPVKMGSVLLNGDYGIYGKCMDPVENSLYPEGVPVLSADEVREGPAQILTTLDNQGVKAYDCEITRLFHQDGAAQRGMVVKITDEELLRRTGGIVQGMSGSPILQNGCLAGAVTHVFLGDSTQGYGIYAEWMLNQSDSLPDAA